MRPAQERALAAHRHARRVAVDHVERACDRAPVGCDDQQTLVAARAPEVHVEALVLDAEADHLVPVELDLAGPDLVGHHELVDRFVGRGVGHRDDDGIVLEVLGVTVDGHAHEVGAGVQAGHLGELVDLLPLDVEPVSILQGDGPDRRVAQRFEVYVQDPAGVGSDAAALEGAGDRRRGAEQQQAGGSYRSHGHVPFTRGLAHHRLVRAAGITVTGPGTPTSDWEDPPDRCIMAPRPHRCPPGPPGP